MSRIAQTNSTDSIDSVLSETFVENNGLDSIEKTVIKQTFMDYIKDASTVSKANEEDLTHWLYDSLLENNTQEKSDDSLFENNDAQEKIDDAHEEDVNEKVVSNTDLSKPSEIVPFQFIKDSEDLDSTPSHQWIGHRW